MFGSCPAAAEPAALANYPGGGPAPAVSSHARKRALFGELYLPGWQCRPLMVGAMRALGLRPSPEGFVEASWAWRSCPIILTCENKQETKLWERTI
jgi:hypothetical protein